MSTNFPGALDSYATLVDGTDILEAADQNNVRDAIEAMQAKIGVTTSGVASSHEYRIAQLEGGIIGASGVTVKNAAMGAANTWEDLDLSAYVGSKMALVMLEWVSASGEICYCKPKGYGSTPPNTTHSANYNVGGLGVFDTLAGDYVYTMMMTNGSGVLQIAANGGGTHTIKLVGYIN